ncbi:MAG: hypothetical protein HZA78_11710 [Candidatus Schekmanbacteria bacterium]|nr:hypothetical protein [Candidatus Schekmanbacteria bacterium]
MPKLNKLLVAFSIRNPKRHCEAALPPKQSHVHTWRLLRSARNDTSGSPYCYPTNKLLGGAVFILTCLALPNNAWASGAVIPACAAIKAQSKNPVTWDNIILVGTICSNDKKLNMAIIENKKIQAVYREGSKLPDGGTIKGIFSDHVSVEKEKQTKIIKITGGSPAKQDKPIFDRSQFKAKGYQKIASDKFIIDPNKIFKSLKEVSQLSIDLKTKKTADGFLIESTGGNKLVTDLGIQAGDVISKVNNHKFDSVYDAIDYIWDMGNDSMLNFEIARGGVKKNIEIFPYQPGSNNNTNSRKETHTKAKHEYVMNNMVYR